MPKKSVATQPESIELEAAMKSLKEALKKVNTAEKETNGYDKNRIAPAVVAQIIELIAMAKNLFADYSATLTPAERQRLIASGVKNIGFIQASYMSAEGHPSFVPLYITMASYTEDKEDFELKRALLSEVSDLNSEISDSMLIASDVVYRDSLAYYNTVKEAVKQKIPGAEVEFNMLKTYFDRPKRSSQSETPTIEKLTRDFNALVSGSKEGEIMVQKTAPVIEKAKISVTDTVHSPDVSIRENITESMNVK